MPLSISPASIERFYRAALVGLRALEARERAPRRFGAEAEQRWKDFRGHLKDSDRLDMLVRDAAVSWGPAFAPSKVFGLPGVAEDEPFGPQWRGVDELMARRLWSEGGGPATLDACARALGLTPARIQWADPGPAPFGRAGLTPPALEVVLVPRIQPSTRLILAGAGAILAVGQHFVDHPELRWAEQILVVASDPRHRQIAGLVAVILGEDKPTRLVWPESDARAVLQRERFVQVTGGVASKDAPGQDVAFAARAVGPG